MIFFLWNLKLFKVVSHIMICLCPYSIYLKPGQK